MGIHKDALSWMKSTCTKAKIVDCEPKSFEIRKSKDTSIWYSDGFIVTVGMLKILSWRIIIFQKHEISNITDTLYHSLQYLVRRKHLLELFLVIRPHPADQVNCILSIPYLLPNTDEIWYGLPFYEFLPFLFMLS